MHCFFFQAEDGIRDHCVTGVQTCALPIFRAIRVAFDYREEFARDAVVDVVCYRRWGHNETDEPAYTQPLLYRKIQGHPSVRERYGRLLVTRKRSEERRVGKAGRRPGPP